MCDLGSHCGAGSHHSAGSSFTPACAMVPSARAQAIMASPDSRSATPNTASVSAARTVTASTPFRELGLSARTARRDTEDGSLAACRGPRLLRRAWWCSGLTALPMLELADPLIVSPLRPRNLEKNSGLSSGFRIEALGLVYGTLGEFRYSNSLASERQRAPLTTPRSEARSR